MGGQRYEILIGDDSDRPFPPASDALRRRIIERFGLPGALVMLRGECSYASERQLGKALPNMGCKA